MKEQLYPVEQFQLAVDSQFWEQLRNGGHVGSKEWLIDPLNQIEVEEEAASAVREDKQIVRKAKTVHRTVLILQFIFVMFSYYF